VGGIIFYLLFIIYIFSGGNISQVQSTNNWYEISNLTHLYFMLSIVFSDFHHDCRVVTIHIFLNATSKNAPHLYLLFLQCSHKSAMFVGCLPYIFLRSQTRLWLRQGAIDKERNFSCTFFKQRNWLVDMIFWDIWLVDQTREPEWVLTFYARGPTF